MHVIVVGAGIGGLAAALSLEAAGVEVTVLEAVRRPLALGVGINLQPHAVRELTELGLGDALDGTGIATAEVLHVDRHGNHILTQPRGHGLGYRWPQYSIHRGELQMLLLDAVRARLGDGAVRFGVCVEDVEERSGGVTVLGRDRATGRASTVTGDALAAADRLHSVVRARYHPGGTALRHAGIRMWRGLCETDRWLTGRTMVIAGSNAAPRMVAYPISRRADDRGRSWVNWVAEVPDPVGADGHEPDWNRAGHPADVLAHFDGWGPDWLDAAGLIRGSPEVLQYPMVDREPLPRWGGERVTLLGDAAHPMLPVGSNGGSQAIVDARVLAHALATEGRAVAGLRAYQDARRETTAALVLATRSNPTDTFMRLVERRAPGGFARIEDVLSPDELDGMAGTYRRITHDDVEILNHRPSLTPAGPV
jgi:2-polyprenyl-6-methoxyphenol hydroxylase-like FAD-dependent oxidoreductase